MKKQIIKRGYDIFGKAYSVMLRNDLHDINSIDHKFMQEMILLNDETRTVLYSHKPIRKDFQQHELFSFAQQFKGESEYQTIKNILTYTANTAANYHVPFEEMKFGGTEKEIIERGTDWCADMARVGVTLLGCNSIPARIIHLVNPEKAYNGHVVTEAFYEGKYGVCDFIYGYCFYHEEPLDAYTLMRVKHYLEAYSENYASLYSAIAINEYNPLDKDNNYAVSSPNEYYLKLINTDHNDKWIMEEE